MKLNQMGLCLISAAVLTNACAKKSTTNVAGGDTTNTTSSNNQAYSGPCNPNGAPFGAGEGTATTPYVICAAKQIGNIEDDTKYLSANFILYNDLDLKGADLATPSEFSGVFDGQNHTISNANMHTPFVDTLSGTVKNLKFASANGWGSYRFGIVAGHVLTTGSISNVTVDAALLVSYGSGGIAGYNEGTISHCTAKVSTTGTDHHGGIAGYNRGNINTSFATGTITMGGDHGGGLVGENLAATTGGTPGTIQNSGSTVTVSGTSNVGGFVGSNEGNITNGFSRGTVTGSAANVGGFAGGNTGGITNSYWDQQTSGMSTSAGGATGLSSAAMGNSASFAGWDFTSIWAAPTAGYPTLR